MSLRRRHNRDDRVDIFQSLLSHSCPLLKHSSCRRHPSIADIRGRSFGGGRLCKPAGLKSDATWRGTRTRSVPSNRPLSSSFLPGTRLCTKLSARLLCHSPVVIPIQTEREPVLTSVSSRIRDESREQVRVRRVWSSAADPWRRAQGNF